MSKVERYDGSWSGSHITQQEKGRYVLHDDFIKSHHFNEARERERFEAQEECDLTRNSDGCYTPGVEIRWGGWRACALARAKQNGGWITYERRSTT